MKKIFYLTVCLLTLSMSGVLAQSSIRKKADKFYYDLQYASAISLYETYLSKMPGNAQAKEAKTKLADCYWQINDSKNSERLYKQLANQSGTPDLLLRYAQALAQNGNYEESKKWFERYQQVRGDDVRATENVTALQNLSALTKDSSDFQISYLALNTKEEDFSPAFYKNGLAFCSSRPDWQPAKHVFGWNNTSFLNIYFTEDMTAILGATPKPLTGSPATDALAIKMGGEVNSIYHEGPMVFFSQGDSMIFTRNNYINKKYKTDKEGVNRLKLFTAKIENGKWTDIKELPFNNDQYSVGHPALSPDEQTLYFISDMPGGKGTDLWYSKRENGRWSSPKNMGNVINTEGREMFPFVDKEGNLYFASDGHGSLGGLDIFFSRFNGKDFDRPVNLGYPINSRKDDFGLIVKEDGRSGYFSSHRNGEKTGDDIYSFTSKKPLGKSFSLTGIVRQEGKNEIIPGAVVVLTDASGKEIARAITDSMAAFTFTVEPDKAYTLHSEKEDFMPNDVKISTIGLVAGEPVEHQILLNKKGAYSLSGLIADRKSKQPLDSVNVLITDARTGTDLKKITTQKGGDFKLSLVEIKKSDGINYIIKLSRNGYLSKSVRFDHVFADPGEVRMDQSLDFMLDKIEVGADIGKILKINPIYFDLGKAVIRLDAASELDKIVKVMTENPGMKIELGSHTDARGSDASNLSLSDKRAKASASYIVSKGIVADRITGKGYGETHLVNQCGNGVKCSETDHQFNRRTEFLIVSLGK
jgi:outer membrane protein OmpA-like peptidoglycan-associated protein